MISFSAAGHAQAEDQQFGTSHGYHDSSYDEFRYTQAEQHQPLEPVANRLLPSAAATHFPLHPFHFPLQPTAVNQQFQADAQQHLQILLQQQQQQQQQQFQAPDALRFQSPPEPLQFQATEPRQFNLRPAHRRRAPAVGEPAKQSLRKFHKADREKLRRDKLNDQFAELASVLEPDRPKNDKATILGDGIQEVRELRAEVRRLKAEHEALAEESRELTQEKSELREERVTLQTQTEQLQSQLQQRLQLLMPWMSPDMSAMMGRGYYPYHGPPAVPDPGQPVHQQHPPAPYAPFPMHPAYGMLSNRQTDASSHYMHYPHYGPPIPTHSHVERPYAQYATPLHPAPASLMQMQPHQGPMLSGGQGMPEPQPPPRLSDGSRAQATSNSDPEADHSTSSRRVSEEHADVQTTLQLQTGDSSAAAERPLVQHDGGGNCEEGQPKSPDPAASTKTAVEVDESTLVGQRTSASSTPLDLSLRTSSAPSAVSCSSPSSANTDIQALHE